ncbi:uncharacterized protein LOC131325971 [Rhododendron vialii]|uniref:uncharacterized protein LOC131325971 n=1 Tax=Rhododendron vialii TaxID=182163 RepID=UPI00265F9B52|nr:uncharacterized protein LOC131325971 [Rhododendron vialii]
MAKTFLLHKSHADFNEDQVNAFLCDVMTHDLYDTMMPSSINVVTFLSKEDALDTTECQESIKARWSHSFTRLCNRRLCSSVQNLYLLQLINTCFPHFSCTLLESRE